MLKPVKKITKDFVWLFLYYMEFLRLDVSSCFTSSMEDDKNNLNKISSKSEQSLRLTETLIEFLWKHRLLPVVICSIIAMVCNYSALRWEAKEINGSNIVPNDFFPFNQSQLLQNVDTTFFSWLFFFSERKSLRELW